MTKDRLTGRWYTKRNWLGFLILYVEIEEIRDDSNSNSSTFESRTTTLRKFKVATEEDLIDFTLFPPLIKEETQLLNPVQD